MADVPKVNSHGAQPHAEFMEHTSISFVHGGMQRHSESAPSTRCRFQMLVSGCREKVQACLASLAMHITPLAPTLCSDHLAQLLAIYANSGTASHALLRALYARCAFLASDSCPTGSRLTPEDTATALWCCARFPVMGSIAESQHLAALAQVCSCVMPGRAPVSQGASKHASKQPVSKGALLFAGHVCGSAHDLLCRNK
jgi:hypothetical protein